MQTEKRAGRVMRNVAAVLVIILAIVALFQGFRMRGKEALFRNVAVETENLPEEKQSGDDRAKIACEQGKDRMRTGKGGHISGREVCVQRRSGVDPFSWGR